VKWREIVFAMATASLFACRKPEAPPQPPASILLVTLDTTRADAVRPDVAPNFNAIASTARRFAYAYTAVPQTLPSHTSMLTGLYPGGHGLHENGRYLSPKQQLVTERLHAAGYRTAAFVSAFALARRFGLARGFDVYDDNVPEPQNERSARATTDLALAYLAKAPAPAFLWFTTTSRTFPTSRRSHTARASPPTPTSARWRRWTSSSAASSPRGGSASARTRR
jgi:membrane-anchored protein YejM (alkaline phosphatase superfamily)